MTPLWKIQNFSGIFFLFWGWEEKRPPPPWGILGFLRHFGQQTVATQNTWIQGGLGVRGYGGRGI